MEKEREGEIGCAMLRKYRQWRHWILPLFPGARLTTGSHWTARNLYAAIWASRSGAMPSRQAARKKDPSSPSLACRVCWVATARSRTQQNIGGLIRGAMWRSLFLWISFCSIQRILPKLPPSSPTRRRPTSFATTTTRSTDATTRRFYASSIAGAPSETRRRTGRLSYLLRNSWASKSLFKCCAASRPAA